MTASAWVFDAGDADFEQSVIAASHRQPVLVDFWADWCQPCKMLMPVLAKVVDQLQGQLLLAKVDTDREQQLAVRLGIRSLPTVRLYRDGEAVGEFMGAQPEQAVREFLARHLSPPGADARRAAHEAYAAGDLDTAAQLLREGLAANPGDRQLSVDLASVLLAGGKADDAESVLAALPPDLQRDDEVRRLRGQAEFTRRAVALGEPQTAEQRHEQEPADDGALHDLATLRVAEGRFEEALELLLTLLRRNRPFREDAARRDMLAVFGILGDDEPLVQTYRRRLASALF